MIAEVAAHVPDSLGAYRGGVGTGPGGPRARPLADLRDPALFEATLRAFAAGLGIEGGFESRALVSYWSQYYFAVLATPALTALIRLGRPLPLAFETTRLDLDAAGRPACLLVRPDAFGAAPGTAEPMADLVEGHLRPFVELCHARCGLARRVLWGNAAVILDHVVGELGAEAGPAHAEVAACLEWRAGPACARSPLSQSLRPGAAGCRRRRVCCLRRRLPGVPSCGALCPLERDGARKDR